MLPLEGEDLLDAVKVQARQDAIVKNVLKSGSFGLMILGAIATFRGTCCGSVVAGASM